MDLLEGIYTRRSVRRYLDQPVQEGHLIEIIRAGTWAPSGLNNQPWRFVLVTAADILKKLAGLTKYRKIIEGAPACVAVFLDREDIYHEVKDYQAMGACLQNMLLAAHALGLGAVWLGEILNSSDQVRSLLDLPENMQLMAVVAIGHPAEGKRSSSRKELSEVLIKKI